MDTGQINAICSLIIQGARFLNVYPRDLVPTSFPQYPCCFIANTDTSSNPGEHWVAYYVHSPELIEFFDSFAMPPIAYGFELHSHKHNLLQIQSNTSDFCGHFCIYYLFHRALGKPLEFLIRDFSPVNLRQNDLKVNHFISPYLYPSCSFALCFDKTNCNQGCKAPCCFAHVHCPKLVHK